MVCLMLLSLSTMAVQVPAVAEVKPRLGTESSIHLWKVQPLPAIQSASDRHASLQPMAVVIKNTRLQQVARLETMHAGI